jgi:catechol 2,3-dioxygenase-like lactoylglutathione lyase family enzyme
MASSEARSGLGPLHHVGVLVADLEQARALFAGLLGFEIASEAALDDLGLDVIFVRAGAVQIELVWIRDAALRDRRLGAAAARLDHLAFEVEDVRASAARLEGAGVATAAGVGPGAPRGEILRLPSTDNAFSVPETSLDLLVQLLEVTDRPSTCDE